MLQAVLGDVGPRSNLNPLIPWNLINTPPSPGWLSLDLALRIQKDAIVPDRFSPDNSITFPSRRNGCCNDHYDSPRSRAERDAQR